MVRDAELTEAVRDAVESMPASYRELSRRAGIPHVTIVKIMGGRLGASVEVAEALADALAEWEREQAGALAKVAGERRRIREILERGTGGAP